jgi:hypothetical protein
LTPNENHSHDSIVEKIEFATQNQTLANFSSKKEVKKPTCLIVDGVDPDSVEGNRLIKILENYIRVGSVKYQKKVSGDNGEETEVVKPKIRLDKSKKTTQDTKKHKEVKRPIIVI